VRKITIASLVIGGVISIFVLFLYVSNRFALASFCPGCFGFHSVAEDIFADDRTSTAVSQATGALPMAQQRVRAFFQQPLQPPVLFICTTEACYQRIEAHGGISKAISWGNSLLVSPRGLNHTIIAHELTHIAVRNVLGSARYATLPSWFDEGFAVYVSDDRRYLKPPGAGNRCVVSGKDALPLSQAALWRTIVAGDPARAYALSACRIATWAYGHNGDAGLRALIEKLKNGQDFNSAFGR
jgi:hypothetical protein